MHIIPLFNVTTLVFLTLSIRFAKSVIASNVSSALGISQSGPSSSSISVSSQDTDFSSSTGIRSPQPPQFTSGLQAALQCWAQWDEYSTSSTECPKTTITESPITWTSRVVSIIEKTFELCDGHPRAVATGGERTSTSLGEMSGTPYTTYTVVLPPSGIPLSTERTLVTATTTYLATSCATTVPTPKCSIGNDDCKALFSSWTAGGYSRLRPPCTYALPKNPCDNCWIYIPSVRLMYFPVSMTGNFCGSYSTVTPAALPNVTTPTTVQVSGTTFTSGFAYLSYVGVTATGNSGICGTTVAAGILPIPSSELSSYRGHAAAMAIAGDIQYPFNFADLAPNPVPWDAWVSQETCFTQQHYPQCQTITQAAYRPWIAYPSAFWNLNTQWSNCVSGIFGIMDPPTALPTVKQAASPTYPTLSADPTRTAVPKQDPTQSVVRATSKTDQLGPKLPASQDPGVHASESLDQPTHVVSTKHIATSILRTSKLSIGSLAVVPGSRNGVLSIGTNVLSDGEATTIGKTVVSLNSQSLVLGVERSTSTADSASLNAVSVLAAAQTQGKPSAIFTLDGEAYTAYPGGMIAGETTTIDLSRHAAVTVAGHVVSMGDSMVWLDNTSIAFKKSHHRDPRSSTDHTSTKGLIVATFKHGSSRMTLTGYIDSTGNTIVSFGTTTLMCTGHSLVANGTTYTAVGVSNDYMEKTSLPHVISVGDSAAVTAHATHQQSALNSVAGAPTSTAKSSSDASTISLESKLAVVGLAILLLLVS